MMFVYIGFPFERRECGEKLRGSVVYFCLIANNTRKEKLMCGTHLSSSGEVTPISSRHRLFPAMLI